MATCSSRRDSKASVRRFWTAIKDRNLPFGHRPESADHFRSASRPTRRPRLSAEWCMMRRVSTLARGVPMATFSRTKEFREAEFVEADLSGARFRSSDLSGVVMREVDIQGADIDAPWLSNGDGFMLVNGVDVIPLVEAELDRRFPGRSERRATDPDGLRAAWAKLETS